MPIAGFGFTKMTVERNEGKGTKLNIENNVSLKDISEMDTGSSKPAQKTLKFSFVFTSKFAPDFGEIKLEGDVIYIETDKKCKEILKEWKKEKKVPQELLPTVLNAVLSKCAVQAIILSREINLPSPVPLPKVNVN